MKFCLFPSFDILFMVYMDFCCANGTEDTSQMNMQRQNSSLECVGWLCEC